MEGKRVQRIVLDTRGFWRGVVTCLKAALPLVKVLCMVDSDENPAMGFIYEAMAQAKNQIKANFNGVEKNYKPILDIVDECWVDQLHRPLHAARGLFSLPTAIMTRTKKSPADWWDSYGDECPELKRQERRQCASVTKPTFTLDELPSDDEWIAETEDPVLPTDDQWLNNLDRAARRFTRSSLEARAGENSDGERNDIENEIQVQCLSDDDVATILDGSFEVDEDHLDDSDDGHPETTTTGGTDVGSNDGNFGYDDI